MKMLSFIGGTVIRSVNRQAKDPQKSQEALLMSLLEQNRDTEYGKKYGFADIRSIEDYQKKVPVQEYDDFAPYIERMVRGEDNLLTNEKIGHFNKTSGTLGVAKYIPLITAMGKYHMFYGNAVISRQIGYGWNDGKGISLVEGNAIVLESGATYGSASSVVVKHAHSGNMTSQLYTSPVEAKQPAKGVITRYIHARFALQERNVTYVMATFSSIVLEMFRYIESNREMLIHDIETGTIDEKVELPDEVRRSLLSKIKPDPERAAELKKAFEKGFDRPWARNIWPRLQYIHCAAGGTFAPYTSKLKERIIGGDVHIFYFGVSASEGLFSTIYKMDEEDSLLVPDVCFLEFREAEKPDAPCLTMDMLQKDTCYEVIITNQSGLYRYRMHDVVRVTGFHEKLPLIRFENREGYAANIRGEKTSEAAVRNMVEETEKALGIEVADYSIYPDTDSTPPSYVILLELESCPKDVSPEMIRKCLMEKLLVANGNIAHHFEDGYLGDLRLILLQPQTYLLYRDVMIMKGTSASQLKPVHVIRNEFQRRFFFTLQIEENHHHS